MGATMVRVSLHPIHVRQIILAVVMVVEGLPVRQVRIVPIQLV